MAKPTASRKRPMRRTRNQRLMPKPGRKRKPNRRHREDQENLRRAFLGREVSCFITLYPPPVVRASLTEEALPEASPSASG